MFRLHVHFSIMIGRIEHPKPSSSKFGKPPTPTLSVSLRLRLQCKNKTQRQKATVEQQRQRNSKSSLWRRTPTPSFLKSVNDFVKENAAMAKGSLLGESSLNPGFIHSLFKGPRQNRILDIGNSSPSRPLMSSRKSLTHENIDANTKRASPVVEIPIQRSKGKRETHPVVIEEGCKELPIEVDFDSKTTSSPVQDLVRRSLHECKKNISSGDVYVTKFEGPCVPKVDSKNSPSRNSKAESPVQHRGEQKLLVKTVGSKRDNLVGGANKYMFPEADPDVLFNGVDVGLPTHSQHFQDGASSSIAMKDRDCYEHFDEDKEVNEAPDYPVYAVLQAKLAKENRRVDYIKGDGNCFFRALSKQLYSSEKYHTALRNLIVDIIATNKASFAQFVDGEDVQEHVERMGQEQSWATTCEIYAAATLLRREVYMLTPDHLNQTYSWLLFKPVFELESDFKAFDSHTCYITLCNTNGNHYDRIVSDNVNCNCSHPHPQLDGVSCNVDLT